tara:strand:- start:126 stop:326 length:201 start_codon:yes stop_codon:yes gene_type:complete
LLLSEFKYKIIIILAQKKRLRLVFNIGGHSYVVLLFAIFFSLAVFSPLRVFASQIPASQTQKEKMV